MFVLVGISGTQPEISGCRGWGGGLRPDDAAVTLAIKLVYLVLPAEKQVLQVDSTYVAWHWWFAEPCSCFGLRSDVVVEILW